MGIGIGSWTYPWAIGVPGYPYPKEPLSAIGLLQKARDLGVGVVQIADNLPLHNLSKETLKALSKMSAQWSLSLEIGTRGVEPAHLLAYLEIAKCLNAKLLRTLTHAADTDPGLEKVEACIREVLPQFAESNVAIALENYERHSVKDLAVLIKRFESPYVGVCLDTVNSFGALEYPEQVVTELAPHVLSLHIKDFDIKRIESKMGFSIIGSPAGEGRLDIDGIIEQVRKCGKNPNIILELWTPFCETIENTISIEAGWALKSIRFLMKYETTRVPEN